MIIPIRCSCNKIIGNMWEPYQKMITPVEKGGLGVSINTALTALGLVRKCCRKSIMTHQELIDKLLEYGSVQETFPGLAIPSSKAVNVPGEEKTAP
jgi:DNA-directed RNA polymerases I, II, and III subunit RPABC5